ncbi:glucose-1-phosphate adenylyltransferase, partial [candidate division KSB1 bacterium]|nr:glucose-1-phosphate adenylyltransferase [candidate division KSB1 bacterium]
TGADIKNSIVGMRGVVREGTEFRNVVMVGADFYEGEEEQVVVKNSKKTEPALGIGRNCYIENAIIDKNVRIGDGVTIKSKKEEDDYQGEYFWVRDGITVIPKGVVIPPGTDL